MTRTGKAQSIVVLGIVVFCTFIYPPILFAEVPARINYQGYLTDANGNPVDGVFVRATCGDYATISYPSGPVGWGPLNESFDWPPGFYDVTVDTKPVPCIWTLSVVDTDDRKTVKAVLSEAVPVEVTMDKSIIVASWKKNW